MGPPFRVIRCTYCYVCCLPAQSCFKFNAPRGALNDVAVFTILFLSHKPVLLCNLTS